MVFRSHHSNEFGAELINVFHVIVFWSLLVSQMLSSQNIIYNMDAAQHFVCAYGIKNRLDSVREVYTKHVS